MPTISSDENGVPKWSALGLERKAEELIHRFNPSALKRAERTMVSKIVKQCVDRSWLKVDLTRDLGFTPQGSKILGEYIFEPRTIRIDVSIQNDARFDFTLAHEFGHFVLHRGLKIKPSDYAAVELQDAETNFATERKVLSNPRDWIEWQANQFAAAILLPRTTVRAAVIEAQREIGVRRNLGRILLENRGYSVRDFDAILEHLQRIYGASKAVIRNRLGDLQILEDLRDANRSHISRLLRAS